MIRCPLIINIIKVRNEMGPQGAEWIVRYI